MLAEIERDLDGAGLTAWLAVRDLGTGRELTSGPDVAVPIASLTKVPLAMVALERMQDGTLDPAEPVAVPATDSPLTGLAGLSRFAHPATIALEDLVLLSTTLSDNVAADLLFERVAPEAITAWLRAHAVDDVVVRHDIGELGRTPLVGRPDVADLAHLLAIEGGTGGGTTTGHRVSQLDPSRASTGTARGLLDVLAIVWSHDGWAARRVRQMMSESLHRQRLWPEFASDSATWSGKTGTLLNLRHEIGVVEHTAGDRVAVVALSASRVPAAVQPHAEFVLAAAARRLHDHLRATGW